MWSWAGQATSLSLGFPCCKIKMVVPTSQGSGTTYCLTHPKAWSAAFTHHPADFHGMQSARFLRPKPNRTVLCSIEGYICKQVRPVMVSQRRDGVCTGAGGGPSFRGCILKFSRALSGCLAGEGAPGRGKRMNKCVMAQSHTGDWERSPSGWNPMAIWHTK